MIIVDYINSHNVLVEFQDEHKYRKITDYAGFKRGKTDNPYDKTVCGIGFCGVGEFGAGKKYKRIYRIWRSMLGRCYGDNPNGTKACYNGCTVCEEWHNFQNFAKWYTDNYYEIDGQRMAIDKDILCKGNKTYAPDKCIIVPNEINALMVKRENQRGDCPIGVSYNTSAKKFVASCWTGKKDKEWIGNYNCAAEAFEAYKQRKETYIKEVADKYKDKIPKKLYEALYNYEIEITD